MSPGKGYFLLGPSKEGNGGPNPLPFTALFFVPHAALCTDGYMALSHAVWQGEAKRNENTGGENSEEN